MKTHLQRETLKKAVTNIALIYFLYHHPRGIAIPGKYNFYSDYCMMFLKYDINILQLDICGVRY